MIATLLLLAAQVPGGLAYEPPAGWLRAVNPQTGLVTFAPPGLPRNRSCAIAIFPAEAVTAPAQDYHNEMVRRATLNSRLLEPPQHAGNGAFLVTALHELAPNGAPIWIMLYTARWGDRGQTIMFSADAPDLVKRYAPAADAMVHAMTVPQVASAPAPSSPALAPSGAVSTPPPCLRPQGIEICPKAVVTGPNAIALTGAYLAAAPRTGYSVQGGVQSRVETTILLLFANGVAARAPAVSSGAIDDTYWAEGLATMDPRNVADIGARSAGRWTESGGTVTITWQIGAPQRLTRDGKTLREQYVTWNPYPSVDGLRLAARYQHVPPFGPPWGVTLRADGTFQEDGVNEIMGGADINPGFPEHGAGTYEIARWSLILRFPNGFVQRINLMLGAGDPKNPPTIILNGFDFERQ
jgi:hypothetical protein